MSIYNKINAGFSLGTSQPVTSGIEDVIYLFNANDITLTYDATNPLIITGLTAERNAADETVEGGYKFKLTNPDKLKEPYPPRAISIAPESGSATYASTIAAIEALLV